MPPWRRHSKVSGLLPGCLRSIRRSWSRAPCNTCNTDKLFDSLTPGFLLALLLAVDVAAALRSWPLSSVSKVLRQYIVPAVASLGLRSVAAQGPARTIPCGLIDECIFVVSEAGLLTQNQTRAGACAEMCERLDFRGEMGITDIAPGAFTNLPKVREILLMHNLLSSIKNGTFDSLPNLRKIDLSYNKIVSIEAGAISNAPELDHIGLNDQSPGLDVTATLAAQMYVGPQPFSWLSQVGCLSPARATTDAKCSQSQITEKIVGTGLVTCGMVV